MASSSIEISPICIISGASLTARIETITVSVTDSRIGFEAVTYMVADPLISWRELKLKMPFIRSIFNKLGSSKTASKVRSPSISKNTSFKSLVHG